MRLVLIRLDDGMLRPGFVLIRLILTRRSTMGMVWVVPGLARRPTMRMLGLVFVGLVVWFTHDHLLWCLGRRFEFRLPQAQAETGGLGMLDMDEHRIANMLDAVAEIGIGRGQHNAVPRGIA